MSLNYNEAISYLYNLEKFGISLGLHKIEQILAHFNNPHDKLAIIHIAGTNGKGSTASIIESILIEHGFNVGLYTSPHLIKFNERIRINKEEISDEDIVKYVFKLKPITDKINQKDSVTFFDFTTALAYMYFYDKNVDYAVMEVGLGGALDSTNIVKKPIVSIITNISKEHEEFLGDSLEDIAKEKGGIIKENGILVTGETKKVPLKVFENITKEKNSQFYIVNNNVKITIMKNSFDYISGKYDFNDLHCNLLGKHQVRNAALAIYALEKAGFNLDYENVKKGLSKVKWEGRLEIAQKNPLFLIDGAHNPAGAEVLKENLKLFKYNKLFFIISVMADKDIDSIFSKLLPYADNIIFTKAAIERAADKNLLKEKAVKYCKNIIFIENIKKAIEKAFTIADKNDMIIFTGSLYAVGEAKEFFGNEKGKFSMGNNYK